MKQYKYYFEQRIVCLDCKNEWDGKRIQLGETKCDHCKSVNVAFKGSSKLTGEFFATSVRVNNDKTICKNARTVPVSGV
jgi:ribosomal protein L37AE/L43A